MKRIGQFLAVSVVALSVVTLFLGPVNILEISRLGDDPRFFLRAPFPLGQSFVATYIHSVQKTPVEDEYVIQGQKLWQWEERFVSHNAGLPVDVPRNGFFREQENWMVIRGGRFSFDSLAYRVGTRNLGRNRLKLTGYGDWRLYSLCPGERLVIRVEQEPLLWGVTKVLFPDRGRSTCP